MAVAEWKRSINMCEVSHAQHRNELSQIKLGFNRIRFAMRQIRVCESVKDMR